METFTAFSRRLLSLSAQEASALWHSMVDSEHLLIAISRQDSYLIDRYLKNEDFNTKIITDQILELHPKGNHPQNMFTYSDSIKKIFEESIIISRNFGFDFVSEDHVFLAVFYSDNLAKRILNQNGIYEEDVVEDIKNLKKNIDRLKSIEISKYLEKKSKEAEKDEKDKKQSELFKYTEDLTELARKGELDRISMRDAEMDRVIRVLARREKNTPLITGESGVGKTAIVRGLSQKIVEGKVPQFLKNKSVLSLSMSKLISGTKYKGELEERIGRIIGEIKNRGDVILFIDDFQSISIMSVQDNTAEAANMLKQMLTDSKIRVIGACSTPEYKRYIRSDVALKRRVQEIEIKEPGVSDTVAMIKGTLKSYEKFYKMDIPDETVESAVKYAKRYISGKLLPDSAIDVLDETAASKVVLRNETYDRIRDIVVHSRSVEEELKHLTCDDPPYVKRQHEDKLDSLAAELSIYSVDDMAEYNEYSIIKKEDIAKTVGVMTGIPVEKISRGENEKLLNMKSELSKAIIGQEAAVDSVSRAVKRSRTGIKDPKKPIGSFIFIGPTGVGKTELAKALARQLFDDENAIIRLDMSEYSQQFDATKMIGSPPGYIGHKDGGQLTEQVMKKPYSIVLFDEIEKAHRDIFNLLLQILDEGTLTDSRGVKVNFKNTIIIMTSNLGATKINSKNQLGFGKKDWSKSQSEKDTEFKSELKKYFKAEFLNRVDDIITFNQLSRQDIGKIVRLMIHRLQDRLSEKNITIFIDEGAVDYLVETGYSEEYGARPMNRAIQVNVEDELAQKMLTGELKPYDSIEITVKDDKLQFIVSDNLQITQKSEIVNFDMLDKEDIWQD